MKKKVFEKFKEYHFEFRHVTVIFIVLLSFQIIVSVINKSSIQSFLGTTKEWYQKESAEEIANLSATSIELVIESINPGKVLAPEEARRLIQSFDIIFSQQQLTHNIDQLFIVIPGDSSALCIDNGKDLYNVLYEGGDRAQVTPAAGSYQEITTLYKSLEHQLKSSEKIITLLTDGQAYRIFVPFVIKGEYMGAIYMLISPDFSFISNQIISNYDETSVIYLSLITLGLMAMYFISSYTVKERDETQKILFEESEKNLKKQINYEKELVFTKRIYHTHHKAEKVMGFIKEDLRILDVNNIEEVKYRVSKYSSFISRVIYDMKWFDPPVHTIRSQIFRTDLNEVISFIVKNIFKRIAAVSDSHRIVCAFDEKLPIVNINEFVVWEIIEPIIQNSIDHGGDGDLITSIKTVHYPEKGSSAILIEDNGRGIAPELLEISDQGVKKIFLESTTTHTRGDRNSGYGCYITYHMAKRCGWEIDAENLPGGGCRFTISIKH